MPSVYKEMFYAHFKAADFIGKEVDKPFLSRGLTVLTVTIY